MTRIDRRTFFTATMTSLCAALPMEHEYRPILLELCVRMANQLITRLQPDGMFDGRARSVAGRAVSP